MGPILNELFGLTILFIRHSRWYCFLRKKEKKEKENQINPQNEYSNLLFTCKSKAHYTPSPPMPLTFSQPQLKQPLMITHKIMPSSQFLLRAIAESRTRNMKMTAAMKEATTALLTLWQKSLNCWQIAGQFVLPLCAKYTMEAAAAAAAVVKAIITCKSSFFFFFRHNCSQV